MQEARSFGRGSFSSGEGETRAVGHARSGDRRWQVIVSDLRQPDGTYGRIARVVVGPKRVAKPVLAEIELSHAKSPEARTRAAEGLTVGQLLTRWLEHASDFQGRSPSTCGSTAALLPSN